MINLHLSKAFRNTILPLREISSTNQLYADYTGLLHLLEDAFGLSGYSENTEYLRVELYRQSLQEYAEKHPEAFYLKSYKVDKFATATVCLSYRDAMILAGWSGVSEPTRAPVRLAVFSGVDEIFRRKIQADAQHRFAFGYADRFEQALQTLIREKQCPIQSLTLYEPMHLQPRHVQRLCAILQEQQIQVHMSPVSRIVQAAASDSASDLAAFQRKLLKPEDQTEKTLKNDGSLIILRANSDQYAARWLAQLLRENPDYRPALLAPKGGSLLVQSMQMEGLPTPGVQSSSLARPSLQVLKLAPVFLWQPFDIYKVMEFVNLPLIPLDEQLAATISKVLAEKPGINSDLWYGRVLDYLDTADEQVRNDFRFLFQRRRYDSNKTIPKREVLELYRFIHEWARRSARTENTPEWPVLVGQAGRICDLLEALPDEQMSYLDIEHIIRTVYEAAPVAITEDQVGALPLTTDPGAIIDEVNATIWWNAVDQSATAVPDFWTSTERSWLSSDGVEVDLPTKSDQLDKLLQIRPLLSCKNQFIFILPDKVAGDDTLAHPLLVLMEAAFKNTEHITYRLDDKSDLKRLSSTCFAFQHMALPAEIQISCTERTKPPLFIETTADTTLQTEEPESVSTLQELLYYPHVWFFKKQLNLKGARILSIKSDKTLLGTLAHRFFEDMLVLPELRKMSQQEVFAWVEQQSRQIMEQEGATLLLYGREIEQQLFLHTVKNGIWMFTKMLQDNGWSVDEVEKSYTGSILGIPIKCRTDVILSRGPERAIIDLKWSGRNYRSELIQNEDDIQLISYAHALEPVAYWPHTGFYIISEGKLIMRNRLAFQNAIVPGKPTGETHGEVAQRIFGRMEKTLEWRNEQLRDGKIEVRTTDTAPDLEAIYQGELLELLNLPAESGKFDDFLTLVYGH